MNIDIFHTHIEVSPYTYGDCPELEKYLSVWNKSTFSFLPLGYMVEDNVLYVPRSLNVNFIISNIQSMSGYDPNETIIPTMHYDYDEYQLIPDKYSMTAEPRDRIQVDSCEFMTSTGKFSNKSRGSQYMLNLDTGFGKTFTMIHTIMHYKTKALIIVNRDNLAKQWVDEICHMTNLPKNKVIYIDNPDSFKQAADKKSYGYVFTITHQRIESYASTYGWNAVREWFKKCKFGIKCVDEAHRYFENTLHLDFFSNTFKTYYLTATYGRTQPAEQRIYDISFRGVQRFGEQTSSYDEVRKHVNFVAIQIRSHPSVYVSVKGPRGFSNYKYIDYALKEEGNTLLRAYKRLLEQIDHLEGRILVISPKIESTETIAEFTRKNTTKSCYAVHSKLKDEEREIALNADVISTTFGTIGEGLNIKKLRCIIVLQAIGNKINMSQLRGRLREYDKDHDTFIFYIIDTSIPELNEIFRRAVKPVMKEKAKEIVMMNWYDL